MVAEVLGQENMDVPAQKEREFAFPSLFCSILATADWMAPNHVAKGRLLYPVYQLKC